MIVTPTIQKFLREEWTLEVIYDEFGEVEREWEARVFLSVGKGHVAQGKDINDALLLLEKFLEDKKP